MTDRMPGSQVSSSKKLKSSPSAHDFLNNCSINAQESSKKSKTGRENEMVLLHPNSSCSPEESVFSIDHILESIFGELDRPTLLSCRLVSRRWAHFSSISLQKIITFEITIKISNDQILICNDNRNRTIKDLTTLMDNSISFPFPCTSFSFENNLGGKTVLLAQRFLNAQGPSIRKLKFGGYIHVSDLKRLLLNQAPNLEQLFLYGVEFANTASESRFSISSRDSLLFSETSTSGPSKPSFKNLKVFKCDLSIPDTFLKQLLECSPNLIEVFLKLDYLHCLVQPVNRLHLLKKLVIAVSEDNIKSLRAIANNPSDNWAVQEIQCVTDNIDSNLASQAAEALSKILKGCSATCRTLSWKAVFGGLRIPHMIGVRHFSYGASRLPVNMFPEGVSLGDTFPNLRSLEISCDYYDKEHLTIQKMLAVDVPIPLPNVMKVSLYFIAGQKLEAFLLEMFPNAVIKIHALLAVESDGEEVESDDEEAESDDEEVESDDEEVESDDEEVESDDEEVESDGEDVENDDEDVENDDAFT